MHEAMSYELVGSIFVVVHTSQPPSDEEWTRYLESFRPHRDEVAGILVYTLGGGPSAKQRGALVTVFGDRPPPTAVLTSSAIARGMVTALAWLKGNFIQAFKPDELAAALSYLAVEPSRRGPVERAFYKLNEGLNRKVA